MTPYDYNKSMNKLVILTVTALILTACNATNTSNPPASTPPAQDFIMKGTVIIKQKDGSSALFFDEDEVDKDRSRFYFAMNDYYENKNSYRFRSGFVSTDGTIEATLPAHVAQYRTIPLAKMLEYSEGEKNQCQNNLQVSNDAEGTLITGGIFEVKPKGIENSYRVRFPMNKEGEFVHFLYANKATRIGGSLTCKKVAKGMSEQSSIIFEKDLEIKPGWNELKYKVDTKSNTADRSYNSSQIFISSTPNNVYEWNTNEDLTIYP